MDESPGGPGLQDVADAVTDLARVVARQQQTLDRLADGARRQETGSADPVLLTDLYALHRDAVALAATARTRRERVGFETMIDSLARMIVGRGGTLVSPAPGAPFDHATMEATEVVDTDVAADDRTVASVIEAGLVVTEPRRSLRPARVVVRRYRSP
ncbi:nucleotide exchange factor GrpE [Jatrophihabitans fulvus]